MKTKITLSFLVVLFCTVSIFAQKKIMFVGTGTAASVDDAVVIAKLQQQGFTVTFIGQGDLAIAGGVPSNATTATTFAECDAVVASSSVSGGTVAPFALYCVGETVAKPYMTWEAANFDEIGVMSGTGGILPRDFNATTNSAIGSNFIGSLTTFAYTTGPVTMNSSTNASALATGYVSIATAIAASKLVATNDTTITVGYYLAKGATNREGAQSGANVIAWNMFNNSNNSITPEGWELFLRAVCVLAGKVYVASTGIKDIASYDVNSKIWYANGNLNMDIWKNLKNSQLNIYNTEGKMISKTQISGSGLITIPVSNLKSGLYMVVGEGFKGKFLKN